MDLSTVRRLQAKGLAQLVTFDRTCRVGELSDRYGTPWATVQMPALPRETPATADEVTAMERAERDQTMFEAKRHNGGHGYDYTPVLSETGAMVGWRYRSTLRGHGWATVDGQLLGQPWSGAWVSSDAVLVPERPGGGLAGFCGAVRAVTVRVSCRSRTSPNSRSMRLRRRKGQIPRIAGSPHCRGVN
ncbi:hypothetical protein ACIO93_43690 [Streptomyces sp. NPDC087903]|uniref:hypothetical protein n=1 Tax=Streptomyces sp. NPDC087903 TaxID=3365819 RepID=UPI0037FC2DE7